MTDARQARSHTPRETRVAPAARAETHDAEERDPRALEDVIHASIHEAILDHRLSPGTKLKEVALAELFGTTRGTIRKVLTRLAHERVVDLRPNRGAAVASPSVEESRSLFAARRAIECAIVDTLTRRIRKADVLALRSLVKEEHEAYRSGQMRSGLKLSIAFHRRLAELSGNSVLAEFLEQLVARTPLVVLSYKGSGLHASCSLDEHSVLLDAIAAGDADRAVALMKRHLANLEGQLNFREEDQTPDLAQIFGARRG